MTHESCRFISTVSDGNGGIAEADAVSRPQFHVPEEELVDLRRRIDFAAWEKPDILSRELRAAFKSLT